MDLQSPEALYEAARSAQTRAHAFLEVMEREFPGGRFVFTAELEAPGIGVAPVTASMGVDSMPQFCRMLSTVVAERLAVIERELHAAKKGPKLS